jgi:uncharacterized membrane protein YkvI
MTKNSSLANGFKIAAVYTGVILGAGFASGQELLKYFVSHGTAGLWGLILSGVVFSLTGWAVLDICRKQNIKTYSGMMRYLLGDTFSLITEWLVAAFLFVLFVAMLAGGGAAFEQALSLPFTLGAAAVAVFCFTVLLFGLNGFVRVNAWLAPVLVFGGIFVGLYAFFNQTENVFAGALAAPGWVLAAMVYAAYNLVTGIPVLAASASLAPRSRDAMLGGLLGGGVMTLLGICLALPLYLHYSQVISVEIPFLVITLGYGNLINILYLTVLLVALFTTAVCNAFGLMEWLRSRFNRFFPDGKTPVVKLAVFCLLSVAAAHVGFSNIVGFVYPLFGFLGLFKIIVVLINWRFRKS